MIRTAPPVPSSGTVNELANWAELYAFRHGSITRGKFVSSLRRESISDTYVTDAWTELSERCEVAGETWPMSWSNDSLKCVATKPDLAIFFAALGLRYNIDNEHRELFEQCVSELMKALVPRSIRIGSPRRPPIASGFRDALQRYAEDCCEQIRKSPPSDDKDLGMDVLSWRPFSDRRGGYLHLAGQCATGADWEEKLTDLSINLVKLYLPWQVEPLRFFATPHIVATQNFERLCAEGGLILDRIRLLELESISPISSATMTEVSRLLADLY